MSRNARLGVFILGTLVILATGIFIIGGKKYLFTATYTLKTNFANVAGLDAGADVLIGGVHSGTVRTIDLPNKSGDPITVVMELNESTRHIIRQDSVATIQTEGLLGNQYVAVSFGSSDKPEVKSGDTIASIPPLEMSALLDKANGLLGQGQAAMVNINKVAEHLNSVTAKVDSGNGTVGALVNDRALYNNLDQTASSARAAASSAQTGIKDFQDNMEALKHNFLLKGYFKNRGYEDSGDLGKDEIANLPQATTIKDFTFQAKNLFDKQDSAKLKGQKALNAAGEYLAGNDFGVAVIETSTGKAGSSDSDLTLAQARAMVVRDYIVQHFGFDDTKLKTVALGKETSDTSKADWGLIRVLIYPNGTPIPPDKSADSKPQENSPAASK
ncbi:MlaD family protein [Acidicapsa acidisoli]|uniref:MlaD family protein n=1 Tax=Acidicapsa acidisoli TaxID=1615681 RepID=UPI0021E0C095|nr:MlaD family protein [Acidicapsa acidisoli]